MIEPVQLDLSAVRHEDVRLTFLFATEGRPIDLTSWTAKMSISNAPGDASPLLTLTMTANTNGSRFTLKDAAGGVLELYINKADNAALFTGTGVSAAKLLAYDILITQVSPADTFRYFFGNYELGAGVTS
jgi:hypothetical protein